ncbi:MAG: 50S ribosomal protein L10 [Patescibacteria group bacterium]|jgi:large subunit ribosomal protein L10
MLLTRDQKEQLISKMSDGLEKSKTVLLVNYQGLKVKEIQELKKKLKEQGIGFQIIKNSLLKIALKKANLSIEEGLLDQPVAIVWGDVDEVTPAKLTLEFGKSAEKLEVIGGIVNRSFADVEMIKQLASLPGREELYAKLVGSLNAPMYRLVNALQGNLRSLVYILKQYQEKKV